MAQALQLFTLRPAVLIGGVVLLAAALVGCGTTPVDTPGQTGDAIPEDVVIAAAVVVGDKLAHRMDAEGGDWPVHLRNSRAIVLPDGTLRAEVGPSLTIGDRPGLTRHLRRNQLAGLWRRADQLGLGDPSAGNLQGNPALVTAGPWEIVWILEFQRDGRDWIVMDRIDLEGGPITPERAVSLEQDNIRAMFRALAAMAWASDTTTDDVIRYPERYDFGPDPWSRYRRKAATGGTS